MSMKIRLARGGSKKRPFYSIVATDSRMPRDGRFLEKLGVYNPLLAKDSEDRIKMNVERIQYWLGHRAHARSRRDQGKDRAQQPQGRRSRQAHGGPGQEKGRPRRRACRRMMISIGRPEPGRLTAQKVTA